MKTVMILSVLLCVAALSVRAASVTSVQNKEEPAPEPESDAAAAVKRGASLPQVRFGFCLDGWLSYRGSCYFLSNNPATWGNAQSICASYGANLASVHSIWEYGFLQRMAQTAGHTFVWIGGYYFQGVWRWEDGSFFDYNNWETTSSTDIYQCLQLNSQDSRGWSNHGCSMHFPFICQQSSNC
ncbi:rheacalcin-1-like [Mugil cephalus]|uniref:rheacalcin-1-like n=1 Tax=Mugil cephalus TaxID=48193 RepID=UPI001FB78EBB|nr:rheacalcin-1-like [Mugil cephalus]